MSRLVAVALLLAARSAGAEPFASAGIVFSGGTRGFAIGLEISGGRSDDSSGAFGGLAAGVDVAPWSGDLPRTRAYFEAEGGWTGFGAGVGPAFFFDGSPIAVQLTPFVAMGNIFGCSNYEPWTIGGLYYRYTPRGGLRDFHEGGGFGKVLWLPNNVRDNGVCSH
ncbi:MAG TPA: hypothetical protein VIV11_21255 [Kofleriaceae bacterium]